MELRLPETLSIKKGFYRYKVVVRDPSTLEIAGYLEGNKKFIDMFGGETFYGRSSTSYCFFENKQGETEKLSLTQIDLSDYDLVYLNKDLRVVKVLSPKPQPLIIQPEKPPRKKSKRVYPFKGRSYEKNRRAWKTHVKNPEGKTTYLGYFITEQEAIEAQEKYYANIKTTQEQNG